MLIHWMEKMYINMFVTIKYYSIMKMYTLELHVLKRLDLKINIKSNKWISEYVLFSFSTLRCISLFEVYEKTLASHICVLEKGELV